SLPRADDLPAGCEPGARIVVASSPSAVCAGLLAGCAGLPVRVASGDLAAAAREELRAHGQPVIVVPTRDEAADALLVGLLTEFEAALASEMPWDELPRFTLLTGRDLASLSWVVAKEIARRLQRGSRQPERRLAHFTPAEDSAWVRELRI